MNPNYNHIQLMQNPSIHVDNLQHEIFSILENKFLFGCNDRKQLDRDATISEAVDNGGDRSMKDRRGKVCVLSIDGGGMRSILAGKALAHLENALKEKSGDPEARIAEYIDVAAGTGIGGVLTGMLFGSEDQKVPLFEAEDTWRFLVEKWKRMYNIGGGGGGGGLLKRIFSGGGGGSDLRYATVAFEKAMKEAFVVNGRSLTLKDTLKPVLIPCYDLASSGPFVFSRADSFEMDRFDFRLWEVCRATSSEPEVFEPVLMKSVDGKTKCIAVDGGLVMSNPTATAITHVLHNKHEFPSAHGVEDLLVLSLGSCQSPVGKLDYEQVKRWKAKDWTRPLARISGDCSADMVDDAVAMSFGQNRCSNYVRIQVYSNMGPHVDADPSASNLVGLADEMLKQKNVESVMFGGKRISDHTNFEKLEWFAGELVLEHRRRNGRPTTFAFKQTTA